MNCSTSLWFLRVMCVQLRLILLATAIICTSSSGNGSPPVRRFYMYNPEIIPHAAAALNMLIPQALYNHVPYPLQSYQSEHEDVDEHSEQNHGSGPIQLITLIKPKQQKKRVKKKKPNGKRVKRIKKGSKKCMPFRVRFTKKSDGGAPFPFFLRRNYYNPVRRAVRHNSSWNRLNKWRVAAPGATVTEFPLQETIPSVTGGSPPASPLFNVYGDSRIPVQDVSPKFVHLYDEASVYNEPDYYRFGTYQGKTDAPGGVNLTADVVVYKNDASTERVVTVTPTGAWVPLPKYYRVTQAVPKDGGPNILLTKRCSIEKCLEASEKDSNNVLKNQNP